MHAPIDGADQRDVAPVGSDRRVHLVVEHAANARRKVVGRGDRRRFAGLLHYPDPGHLRHGSADEPLDRPSRRKSRSGRTGREQGHDAVPDICDT